MNRPEHPYDKVVQLLKRVKGDTHKHSCLVTNIYNHRPGVGLQLYLEDGWTKDAYSHWYIRTLDEAVEFLEDFLRHRASRGILFKRF